MLIVDCPDNCHAEYRWIVSVVLGDFLGVPHEIRFGSGDKIRISAGGKALELSCDFFSLASRRWLAFDSLPQERLRHWDVSRSGLDADLPAPKVPVLFGEGSFALRGDTGVLGLDVFGSAFFMLSRYEEAVVDQRDRHDRFPATASIAWREGFLERPLVDEYTEILWAAMLRLWPQLERKARQFKAVVTCDVDHPYHAGARSFPRMLKRMVGETLRTRSMPGAIRPLRNYLGSRNGNWSNDPYYYTVDWMMGVNEKRGNRIAFYFIPEVTDIVMDDTCSIYDDAVKAMMMRIARRGHEIGIHPGYHTYRNKNRVVSGLHRLQRVLEELEISQQIAGGRHHYLRWSTHTPAIWDAAGLDYDSTLSYADCAGFRCGTSHEYPMFDLHGRLPLRVRQRPLICMEASVTDYMGYGLTEAALEKMKALKRSVQAFNGCFTLLWHNSYFENEVAREMYCDIIS